MIDKREIIEEATALGLNPHVIEKDYVIGWLLWGIHDHDALAESWIFKGGTCLKKCFFETYRFSEDLDFTISHPAHFEAGFLRQVFAQIGARIYEETGIELSPDYQQFEIYENPRGSLSCQGRIGYQGPVSPRGRSMPRIKLDLTADERVVLPAVLSPVFHPYSDAPDGGIAVRSYAYEEAFGEKIRALAERARPRDLYDVVNLFRDDNARPVAAVLREVLRQKCEFKGIDIPVLADLEPHRSDFEGGWSAMLAHQLPALPPVETFLDALPAFFTWLEGGSPPPVPAAYPGSPGEELIRERALPLPGSRATRSFLEIIRFAAANRLCVELGYHGTTRRIEPYSLRRTLDGNVVLHAHSVDRDAHRSYRVDRIQDARVTSQTFAPRYAVELTPKGPVAIEPTTPRGWLQDTDGPQRSPRRRSIRASRGPTYVYRCSYCRKRFYRKKRTRTLNPHKDKRGYPCSGRYADLVDTRY